MATDSAKLETAGSPVWPLLKRKDVPPPCESDWRETVHGQRKQSYLNVGLGTASSSLVLPDVQSIQKPHALNDFAGHEPLPGTVESDETA